MSCAHVILTRFSFRFRPDDPIDKLLAPNRLNERIAMFEKYCYASITNQTGRDFYWIIVIDPLLPEEYVNSLNALIQRHKNSDRYASRGPREIWLNQWDWKIDGQPVSTGHKLGRIEWVLEYIKQLKGDNYVAPRYLITTRLDDDDCLVDTYINLVQAEFKRGPIHGFKYISFAVGYQHYVQKKCLRKYRLPMIALGLTLIADITKYPMCVYLGCHTHILGYIRDPKKHVDLHKMYLKNKELPTNAIVLRKQLRERLCIVRSGGPVWVRSVHDFNLQKNIGRNTSGLAKQSFAEIKQIMKSRFGVNL